MFAVFDNEPLSAVVTQWQERRSLEGSWVTPPSTAREITKSSSTFSATNISRNIVWSIQLRDTIQMKSNYTWITHNHDNIAIRNLIMIYNFV